MIRLILASRLRPPFGRTESREPEKKQHVGKTGSNIHFAPSGLPCAPSAFTDSWRVASPDAFCDPVCRPIAARACLFGLGRSPARIG